MDDGKPSLKEALELRITLHRLDAVFEACDKLPEADRETLYEGLRKRLRRYLPQAPVEVPAPNDTLPLKFSDRCLELAAIAPNDKIQNAILMIARAAREADAEAEAEAQ